MTPQRDRYQRLKCTAHRSNGSTCGNWAIRGGRVCAVHGGRAPHVKARARQRLDDMVDPALVELRKLIARADSDSVRLSAIKDILDRTGYKLPERLETDSAVTIKVEYEIIEQPMAEVPRETIVDVQALQLPEGSYTNGAQTNGHS